MNRAARSTSRVMTHADSAPPLNRSRTGSFLSACLLTAFLVTGPAAAARPAIQIAPAPMPPRALGTPWSPAVSPYPGEGTGTHYWIDGVLGSRSGSSVAAAWTVMSVLGED